MIGMLPCVDENMKTVEAGGGQQLQSQRQALCLEARKVEQRFSWGSTAAPWAERAHRAREWFLMIFAFNIF